MWPSLKTVVWSRISNALRGGKTCVDNASSVRPVSARRSGCNADSDSDVVQRLPALAVDRPIRQLQADGNRLAAEEVVVVLDRRHAARLSRSRSAV